MKLSDSPIIHFSRGVTLLATLIAVPGIAICWNHLPKDILHKSAPEPTSLQTEQAQVFRQNFYESAPSGTVFVPESISPAPPETVVATEVYREKSIPLPNPPSFPDADIQQVSWKPAQVNTPQDFAALTQRLNTLGAKYHKLEPWGNRSELFRFSCFVTPSEPLIYEKHFQAIGTDAVAVMKAVIADIEKWKTR